MPYMKQLIEGYHRFRENRWAHERQRWAELAEGQSPQVMILACADSRSDPAEIFDARPGEMFVARNIAALAPPYETSSGFHGVSAALEFAVTQLNVGEILVMGHGKCGGCAAALTGDFDDVPAGEGHFIGDWVRMLSDARDVVRARHAELDRGAFLDMEHEFGESQPRQPPHLPVDQRTRTGRDAQAPRRAFFDLGGPPLCARRGGR